MVPAGSPANASSVGAKTVKGPSPDSVSASPAASRAATSVWNLPSPAAMSTMDPTSCGGRSTESMTWMVPLEACMSAMTTLASLMRTVSPSTLIDTSPPCSVVAESSVATSAAATLPGTTW